MPLVIRIQKPLYTIKSVYTVGCMRWTRWWRWARCSRRRWRRWWGPAWRRRTPWGSLLRWPGHRRPRMAWATCRLRDGEGATSSCCSRCSMRRARRKLSRSDDHLSNRWSLGCVISSLREIRASILGKLLWTIIWSNFELFWVCMPELINKHEPVRFPLRGLAHRRILETPSL